jgi:hypothetical protein
MRQKRRRSESHGKGEASAEKPLTKGEAAEAMNRFRNLTRQLLAVPREKLEAEMRLYEKRRKSRKVVIERRENSN